jgi:hypothetical protein
VGFTERRWRLGAIVVTLAPIWLATAPKKARIAQRDVENPLATTTPASHYFRLFVPFVDLFALS